MTEVAPDCVVPLKNWFEGRGINVFFLDTRHGEFQMDKLLIFVLRNIPLILH